MIYVTNESLLFSMCVICLDYYKENKRLIFIFFLNFFIHYEHNHTLQIININFVIYF